MAFKFYIASQLVNSPGNATGTSTQITRSSEVGGITIEQRTQYRWNKNNGITGSETNGFTLLKNMFDQGICEETTLDIYDQQSAASTVLIYSGVVKISQAVVDYQTDNRAMDITVVVVDNSFYSYIRRNRSLKVNLAATQSKNEVDLTPLEHYTVDLFNSNGCAYGGFAGMYYRGYAVTEALEFIIKAISDDKIGFRSDFLSSQTEPLFLFKGQSLITSFTFYPLAPEPVHEVSFDELSSELHKIHDLSFYIDESDPDNPVFVLENSEANFGSTIVHAFKDLQNLTARISVDDLSSVVNVGSEDVVDGLSPAYTWNQGTSYYGQKKEQFFPRGQCAPEGALDLVSRFIIDNNAIQDALVLQGTKFTDSFFLIQCSNVDTVAKTADGHQFAYFGSNDCFYNLGINNFYKLQRHSSKFETEFGNFLGVGTDGFRALIGDDPAQDIIYTTVPGGAGLVYVPPGGISLPSAPFVNETTNGGYDGGGNYNNTTFKYTVPTDGNYSFLVRLFADVRNMQGTAFGSLDTWDVNVNIQVFDAANVFKFNQLKTFYLSGVYANGTHILDTTMVADILATDYVFVSWQIVYHPNQSGNQQIPRFLGIINNSFYECNGTPEGGIVITSGSSEVRYYLYEFTADLTETEFLNIKANPTSAVTFEKDGVARLGHIKDLQINNQSGRATITVVTKTDSEIN